MTLVILVSLTLTNMISVRSYGEFEFWFASIKVAAIIAVLRDRDRLLVARHLLRAT